MTTRSSDGKKLQDLTYTYDPIGNITHITDGAQEPVFNANQQVKPESDYTYDALYRLIEARGREHPALSPQDEQHGDFDANWIMPLQPLNNGQVLQNYIQQFTYDDGRNLSRIQHQGATPWTRTLTVSDDSNRAVDSQSTDKPTGVNAYFDGNGNQTRMPGLQAISWNYRDNIASVTVIERQNAPSDGEYYVYDATGNRIRKVSEQYGNGGTVAHIEETIYLGTLEIKRITQGSNVVEERHSLRVMDDERAVATRIVWTQGTPPDGAKNPQVRYQLDNHLGSVALEVDGDGQMSSYEEYFPYGGTALIAGQNANEVNLKQYHYSGKELDSVTGFYYYGARYYAPWLGRWMSPDPAGTVDGLNLYAFVGGNPITLVDEKGYNGKEVKRVSIKGKKDYKGRENRKQKIEMKQKQARAKAIEERRKSPRLEANEKEKLEELKKFGKIESSENVGHTFYGYEVQKKIIGFTTLSAIHTTIKSKLTEDILDKAGNILKKIPDYIKEFAKKSHELHASKDDYIHFAKEKGRTILAAGRIMHTQNIPVGPKNPPNPIGGVDPDIDDRSHLVPESAVHSLSLSKVNSTHNIIAENWMINQHFKRAFEAGTKDYAEKNPNDVVITIHVPIYEGDERRPVSVQNYMVVNGIVKSAFTFVNSQIPRSALLSLH
ncbi:MAG: RHS repeat domain-containing protein [Ktedonobacteraceae bacterium]